MTNIKKISSLDMEVLKLMGDLEIAKGEVSSSKVKLTEVEVKAKHDAEMAIHWYWRITAFQRKADSNYLARLKECWAAIIRVYLEIDFSFIATVTIDPDF